MRYICEKYQHQAGTPSLQGSNLVEKAKVDQWLDVEGLTFTPTILTLVTELFFNPAIFGKPTDTKSVQESTPKLAAVLDVYEAQLATNKFIAGNFLSIADLSHLPLGYFYFNLARQQDLLATRKHVAAWWADLTGRPTWQAILQHAAPWHEKWISNLHSATATAVEDCSS